MALFANDGNKAEKAEKGFDKPPPPTMSIPLPNIQTPINCPRSGSSMNEDAQGTSSGDSTVKDPIFKQEDFRNKHSAHLYRVGNPKFAALQYGQHNGSCWRRFGYPISRVLHYRQGRICNLLKQLDVYDNDPENEARGLTTSQTRRVGEPGVPDKLHEILMEIDEELSHYLPLLLLDRDTQCLLPAHENEVEAFYDRVRREKLLDIAGYAPVYDKTDFVYTRPELVHNGLRWLLYSNLGRKLIRSALQDREIPSTYFNIVVKTVLGCFGLFMVIVPTGLLCLVDLSTAASFGVVVGFAVLCFVVLVGANVPIKDLIVGASAYTAVLFTILAQTLVAGGSSCAVSVAT